MKKTCVVSLGILLLGTVLVIGCTREEGSVRVKDGDTVKIHYTGTLEDGTVFDTSDEAKQGAFAAILP